MGLIGLVPFVGAMDIYGYAIATARNLRAGYRVLPPASFNYLGAGAPVFVLSFAWSAIAFLEAIAHVRRDAQDRTLVIVDVTYINQSTSPANVDPADYHARTQAGLSLPVSVDCPSPAAATVAPAERLSQRACFRLPSADTVYDVHLPWIGWDDRTP